MATEVITVLLQVSAVALVGWGAYLCMAGRDRRASSDRRGEGRGGRRSVDARRVRTSTAASAADDKDPERLAA